MKIHLRFLGAIIALLMGLSIVNAAPYQQDDNLLENPSFERPFPNGIAENWQNWFRDDPANTRDPDCLNGYHFRPKWRDELNTDRIHEGFTSQYVGNNWDTWQAGVFQTVTVTPGTTYRFSAFARVYASNEMGATSQNDLQANVRVGIDPNGSELWSDADIVWSGTGSPHDTWQQFSTEVAATGDKITVFTAADWGVQGINQCRQFLDVWFDSAELVEVLPPATATPPPPPTLPPPPPATNTPVSEATPTATSAVPTIAPTATAVPTNTPVPGATICVNAFADENANGLRDENEAYIAGITFRVGNLDTLVGQAVSLGTSEAICFEGVAPGSYQVSQLVPANLQMTTAPNATLDVEEDKTYGVEFGSRIPPVGISNNDTSSPDTIASNNTLPTVAPEISAAPEASGVNWLVVGGIFVAIIAIFGVGAFILLVLRRQSS